MKLPSFQFYPGDWLKDADLRGCTPGARGVWVDILCLMFECKERGVLASNGTPWDEPRIARAAGGDTAATLEFIKELIDAGVLKRREDGAFFSSRMVKDEHIRSVRKDAGKQGGNPSLVNQNSSKTKPPSMRIVKQNPTPSSSSSSSSSDLIPPNPPRGGGRGVRLTQDERVKQRIIAAGLNL